MVKLVDKRSREALMGLVSVHQERLTLPENPTYQREICQFIINQIRNGQLRFGQKVVEAQLAERFKVSIIKVRESVQRLVTEGWVERIPNRGIVVRDFDLDVLKNTFSVREMFEGEAARIVAQTQTSQQIGELAATNRIIEQSLKHGDFESIREADAHFHRLLIHFTGNQKLEEMFESIVLLTHGALFSVNTEFPFDATEVTEFLRFAGHKQIVQAIKARDPKLAEKVARSHVRAGYKSSKIMYEYRMQNAEIE